MPTCWVNLMRELTVEYRARTEPMPLEKVRGAGGHVCMIYTNRTYARDGHLVGGSEARACGCVVGGGGSVTGSVRGRVWWAAMRSVCGGRGETAGAACA